MANENTMTLLEHFATCIRDFEGKPGDRNYRNNNPGNCRFSSVGYLPKYGNVTTDKNGFAIFPTYQQGWEYLQNLIRSKVAKHPSWTIQDFMRHYAPAEDDNDPDRYAAYIASRLAVPIMYPMSKIISD